MNDEKPKLPNPNAVKELRARHQKLKDERLKKYKELGDFFRKKTPEKKIAKATDTPEVEM